MDIMRTAKRTAFGATAVIGATAAAYGGYVAAAWLRYGRPVRDEDGETDALLDMFMPRYDVVERHQIGVDAPVEATYDALLDVDLDDSPLVRAIFKGRELLLGASPSKSRRRRGLVELTQSLGWVRLAEIPGHEIVMGAVTRPWEADVVFRGVPADEFAAFNEPDYVKIIWTLRADEAGPDTSIARTETRAVATDAGARRKFRWYWARFSPGIVLIREVAQRLVKHDAERRARAGAPRAAVVNVRAAG
jgi:hypothetical protein